jgi:Xaa-Pro aminopeptidase
VTPLVQGTGTAALEESGRIDFARLRADRRHRLLEAMAAARIDVLVLGREANARFASGARRLWISGVHPYGPGCLVVGATGAVHLLSTWDDGIPAEIGADQLFGITWNGANLAANLARVPGLAEARHVGVDGMTPGVARLLEAVAPGAELVDASGLLEEARRVKSPDEVACIRTAVALSEAGLARAWEAVAPGVTGRALAGLAAARTAELGATTVDVTPTFTTATARPWPGDPAPGERPWPAPGAEAGFDGGALVTGCVGALYAGYAGPLARTVRCPAAGGSAAGPGAVPESLLRRGTALHEAMLAACRRGQPAGELLAAYGRCGEDIPVGPVAHGVGLGMEPPVVGAALPADAGAGTVLEPGMVLFVEARVRDPRLGELCVGDTVLVGEDGAAVPVRRHE